VGGSERLPTIASVTSNSPYTVYSSFGSGLGLGLKRGLEPGSRGLRRNAGPISQQWVDPKRGRGETGVLARAGGLGDYGFLKRAILYEAG